MSKVLRQWIGDEDSPAAVLKSELLERLGSLRVGLIDRVALRVEQQLQPRIGQQVDLEGLRNLIHAAQTEHELGLFEQDEYELAQELLDAFGL